MMLAGFFCVVALAMAAVLCPRVAAQVQTDVPPVVPGAKAVTVEHVKVHGTSLEGNLKGDAVDRDVFVCVALTAPARPNEAPLHA